VSTLAALLPKTVDGLILSAPLVPPTLDGSKTVTRRMSEKWMKRKVGDLLFVRENWRPRIVKGQATCDSDQVCVTYQAGNAEAWFLLHALYDLGWKMPQTALTANARAGKTWVSSQIIPRWASRCVLRITEPPEWEPVQEITEEECIREGMALPPADAPQCPCEGAEEEPGPHLAHCLWRQPHVDPHESGPHVAAFVCTWTKLHTKPGERWSDNPSVVRLAFERVA